MAASSTLPQQPASRKPIIGRTGVLTLSGFGMKVRMQSGHLETEDGIGPDRRKLRLARVGHGLKRLVLVGSDGFITFEALRWLADQDAAFTMLHRDGKVLFVTGPVRPSDARLRRAQALAGQSPVGIQIAQKLIERKLAGQENVVRHKLLVNQAADVISGYRAKLPNAETFERIRLIEARAAALYWSVWRNLAITFPKKDESRIPDHWRTFGARVSPLTGSPRVAVNPPNAMLNYLYSVLSSESRLAAAALGLDAGMGILHFDEPGRDSLACDLMEVVRSQVDSYLLDWITREALKREWFFERSDGNCRLNASFAARLAETAPMWGRLVAPVAEWLAQQLWISPRKNPIAKQSYPTRLTQSQRREAHGGTVASPTTRVSRRESVCHECGKTIEGGDLHCGNCRIKVATRRMPDVARVGRLTAHSPKAQAKRSATQRHKAMLWRSWKPSTHPAWLTEQLYIDKIQPKLAQISGTEIARSIGVTCAYGSRIRQGERPHRRHWLVLANLTGFHSHLATPP